MKKNSTRFLSLLLVLTMFLSLGTTAFAAAPEVVASEEEGYGSSWDGWDEEPAEEPAPAEEPVEEPVVEEPVEEPVVEEPIEEPVVEEPIEEPIVEEPVEEPIVEEPVEEPVVEEEPEDLLRPANTFFYVGGSGLRITVDAPEGAFPEDAEMSVNEISLAGVQEKIDGSAFAGQTAVVAADISFADAEGNELQPDVPVMVSMSANVAGVENPTVLHIADNGEITEVPQTDAWLDANIVGADTASVNAMASVSDAAANLSLTFEASSFSTYTITWNNSNKVTVHHGIMRNGAFVEFGTNGLPSSSNTNYPTSYALSDYSSNYPNAYLIYDFAGYTYKETRYSANATSTPTNNGTSIWPILNRDSAYSGGTYWWYYSNGWHTPANNSHIYVIYEPKTVTSGYTPPTPGPDDPPQPTPAVPEPDVDKDVTSMKPDGTYDITLSVVGSVDTSETKTTARVIVVLDLSNSMTEYIGSNRRLKVAKDAINAMAKKLLALEDSQHNKLVEMGLVTFGTKSEIETFGSSNFTSDYSTYSSKIDSLSADKGGTNWEQALDQANSMAASTAGKTYIIFVSDGNPTFRVSRGNFADTGNSGLNSESYNSDETLSAGIFGAGAEENFTGTTTRCYDAAKVVAKSIKDHAKEFYAVGLSSQAPLMQNLANYAGGTYKRGDNAQEFADGMADIASAVEESAGFSEVEITDGVTSMSQIETQSLIGTAGNFVYKKVDADGNEVAWANPPEAKINADNSVTWDLSSEGRLENGYTYSVTFTVWPKQEAYDLIADLNNELKHIADLQAGAKAQLRVLVNGTTYEFDPEEGTWTNGLTDAQLQALIDANGATYSMKTNTGLSASYEYGGVPASATYTDYINGNMTLDTSTFGIKKNWNNLLPDDSRTAQWLKDEDGNYVYETDEEGHQILDDQGNPIHVKYIDLIVMKGEEEYETVRLLSTNDWRLDNIFVSLGVLSVSNGKITVRETGHEYTVKELPNDSYYWELTAYTYRPMVINGVSTMLQKVEEGDSDYESVKSMEQLTTKAVDSVTYYAFGGGIYKAIPADSALLQADNNRRSYLNLTKTVTGTGAPEDALFEYKVKIVDPNEEDLWFSAYNDDEVVMDFQVTGATAEIKDGYATGFWSVPSNQEFSFKIKAGWNVRFINLFSGTTYEITESATAMPDGFKFNKIEATAELGGEAQDYNPTIADTKISGKIEAANTDYTVTYTNDYLGFFYVYHSSDNTIEKISILDTTKVVDGKYNIVDARKSGYLYGGYYDDFGGKSSGLTAAAIAALTYTDGVAQDSGKSYDASSMIADSTTKPATKFWVHTNAAKVLHGDETVEAAGKGTELTPVNGDVYFLKEVPEAYLHNRVQYVYDRSKDYEIEQLFTMTAVDDSLYTSVGFNIVVTTKDYEQAKLCSKYTFTQRGPGAETEIITASNTYFANVPRGFVGVYDDGTNNVISIETGTKFTVTPTWTTLDGVDVLGALQGYEFQSTVKGGLVKAATP